MTIRKPFRLVVVTLALAGVAKTGIAVLETSDPLRPRPDRAFVAAAEAAASPEKEPEAAPAARPAAACETPEEMLAAVKQERDLLAAQKEELDQRASEVALAAERVEVETARLGELKQEVEALLARVDQARTADVDRLVNLYRNMKPKEAALIMNDLDIEVSVMVLGTMNERDAAPILARLNPVRAQAISKIILERSKLPGDQKLNGIRLQ
ncbi:MAG: MotE family protein [Paracoccaceae bacterium]